MTTTHCIEGYVKSLLDVYAARTIDASRKNETSIADSAPLPVYPDNLCCPVSTLTLSCGARSRFGVNQSWPLFIAVGRLRNTEISRPLPRSRGESQRSASSHLLVYSTVGKVLYL